MWTVVWAVRVVERMKQGSRGWRMTVGMKRSSDHTTDERKQHSGMQTNHHSRKRPCHLRGTFHHPDGVSSLVTSNKDERHALYSTRRRWIIYIVPASLVAQ